MRFLDGLPLRVGDRVLYLAGTDPWGQERAYEGRVVRVTRNGEFVVHFQGGHTPYTLRARPAQLRRLP